MPLHLYDTLTQQKRPFETAEPGHARIYVCGPTVYDFAHVGHARCYVVYDVLVRHLRASGMKVTYARNITDIDDKILKRATENGETPGALSERFTKAYWEDMARLGNAKPDVEPKVTEHLPQIFEIIQTLIAKGSAYASGGDVYFSVASFPGYGKLSHRKVEALLADASGRTDAEDQSKKKDPADFALWKGASKDQWGWESPWGWGRPGWHLECSAMGKTHLGETLDLHGGGLDLVFPHHENEIAQSEAASGKPLAKLWMHNGFVEVDKTKMSKSLGNFFTAREIFNLYEPEAVRYAMLTVHYRSPLGFAPETEGGKTTFPLFDEAERRVEYVYTTRERLASIDPARIVDAGEVAEALAKYPKALAAALDDDLNMPVALAETSEMLKAVNELVDVSRRKKGTVARAAVEAARTALDALARELGVGEADPAAFLGRLRTRRTKAKGLTEADVDAKIAARTAARDAKDFAAADRLRD
ncbi:MAG TPA: cysteine--tRNA ligase, partial [Polyangiaceae bacterium]|nr:cysteine--tRNA ligase [Polyangiaceae bacterium]